MNEKQRFSFVERDPAHGGFSLMPCMPINLTANSLDVTTLLRLGGNLAKGETRAVAVEGKAADFPPVLLAFAWAQIENYAFDFGAD